MGQLGMSDEGWHVVARASLMGSLPVVMLLICSRHFGRFLQRGRPMQKPPLVFVGAVIAFDIGLLLRLVRGTERSGRCPNRGETKASLKENLAHSGSLPSVGSRSKVSMRGSPYRRKKATTASKAVSARKSSRTCASSKMEVPASTKLQVSTTCCRLPSGSAGTVVTSSSRRSAPLPAAHGGAVAGDEPQADRGSNLLDVKSSKWCEQ